MTPPQEEKISEAAGIAQTTVGRKEVFPEMMPQEENFCEAARIAQETTERAINGQEVYPEMTPQEEIFCEAARIAQETPERAINGQEETVPILQTTAARTIGMTMTAHSKMKGISLPATTSDKRICSITSPSCNLWDDPAVFVRDFDPEAGSSDQPARKLENSDEQSLPMDMLLLIFQKAKMDPSVVASLNQAFRFEMKNHLQQDFLESFLRAHYRVGMDPRTAFYCMGKRCDLSTVFPTLMKKRQLGQVIKIRAYILGDWEAYWASLREGWWKDYGKTPQKTSKLNLPNCNMDSDGGFNKPSPPEESPQLQSFHRPEEHEGGTTSKLPRQTIRDEELQADRFRTPTEVQQPSTAPVECEDASRQVNFEPEAMVEKANHNCDMDLDGPEESPQLHEQKHKGGTTSKPPRQTITDEICPPKELDPQDLALQADGGTATFDGSG